jgi:hypothetical protein
MVKDKKGMGVGQISGNKYPGILLDWFWEITDVFKTTSLRVRKRDLLNTKQ